MSLTKSKGNMYPWVTHTHSHLGGECSHKCTYCYVDSFRHRVPKYQGELRLIGKELLVNYGSGKTIFIENCNDLFAKELPDGFIGKVLEHCRKFPDNTYVFQSKNPGRYKSFISETIKLFPPKCILGVTVETNREALGISNAPCGQTRLSEMMELKCPKFITIEPILDFDVTEFSDWIIAVKPDFINIGADSKRHGLQEPTMEKVQQLIDRINDTGIEIREKSNLDRLR